MPKRTKDRAFAEQKTIYMNEDRDKLLREARKQWPDKSDSKIIFDCIEACVETENTRESVSEFLARH